MGQLYALLVLTVAAAESALGLAILVFIIVYVVVFLWFNIFIKIVIYVFNSSDIFKSLSFVMDFKDPATSILKV